MRDNPEKVKTMNSKDVFITMPVSQDCPRTSYTRAKSPLEYESRYHWQVVISKI